MANTMSQEEELESILNLCTIETKPCQDFDAVKFAELAGTLANFLRTFSYRDERAGHKLTMAVESLTSIWLKCLCPREVFLRSGAIQGYCRLLLAAEETIESNPSAELIENAQERSLRTLIDISKDYMIETLERGVLNAILARYHSLSDHTKFLVMHLAKIMCRQVAYQRNPVDISGEAFSVIISVMDSDYVACQCVMLLVRAYLQCEQGKEFFLRSEFVLGLVRLFSVFLDLPDSVMQEFLGMFLECARVSSAFKLNLCQPQISASLSQLAPQALRHPNRLALNIVLQIIECLVENSEHAEGKDGENGMYLEFAGEMTQVLTDIYCVSTVSSQKIHCVTAIEKVVKSITKMEDVAGLLRDTNIIGFFLQDLIWCYRPSNIDFDVPEKVVSIICSLSEKFPTEFSRRFIREGGAFALHNMIYKFSVHSQKISESDVNSRRRIQCIKEKAQYILQHSHNLANSRSLLKKEASLSAEKVQTTMEMIFEICRKEKDDDSLDDGMTAQEIFLCEIVEILLDYFENDEKESANSEMHHARKKQHRMFEVQRYDKRIQALMRLCLSSSHKPIFDKYWSNVVRKLRQCLDVSLHTEMHWAHQLLLLLSILQRANDMIPNIIRRLLVEESVTGWTYPLNIQDESTLQSQCAVPANEFLSRVWIMVSEKYPKQGWLLQLTNSVLHLLPFAAKTSLLYRRLDEEYDDEEETVIKVDRQNLIPSAETSFETISLEPKKTIFVIFKGEKGEGDGPKTELFTLLSQELHQFHSLWRCSNSLFPCPYHPSCSKDEVMSKFLLLGRLMAKALREQKLLDIPLSRAFYKMAFLEENLNIDDILEFDSELGWHLLELEAIANLNKCTYRGCKIQDLGLCFRLPGYEEYILKNRFSFAKDVDVFVDSSNLKEYVQKVVEATLVEGVRKQMEEFRRGFNEILELSLMKLFSAKELQMLFCGEGQGQPWNRELLEKCIIFEFEAWEEQKKMSKFIENVIGILSDFNEEEQKRFLVFVRGTPRLPVGGLEALEAADQCITVTAIPGVDGELPSAATCMQTLYVPYYNGQKHVMRAKLSYAITHGCGSFGCA